MGMSERREMESFHIIWDRNILSSFIPKAKLLDIQQQFQVRIQTPNWTLTAWLSILEDTHGDKNTLFPFYNYWSSLTLL